MEYEFDPAKSAANRDKHGMDFVTAQVMWQVPALIMPSAYPAEERWLRTARLGDRFWTAVYTLAGCQDKDCLGQARTKVGGEEV